MKKLNRENKLFFTVVLILFIHTFTSIAFAAATMTWCTTWYSRYTDAGRGEDVFNSSSWQYRPAAYAYYHVKNMTDNNIVASGTLDVNGCTPALPLLSDKTYQVRQYTWAKRGSRNFMILADTVGWDSETTDGINNYFFTDTVSNTAYSYTFNPPFHSAKTNIMPILGRILRYYYMYGLPDSFTSRIHTNTDNCNDPGGGGAYVWNSNICLAPSQEGWADPTYNKYITAHEIGHVIRWLNVHDSKSANYYTAGDAPDSQPKCTCKEVDTGIAAHCLGSRELIAAAENEGFSHFFATAIYNSLVEDDGIYVYPKEAWVYANNTWEVEPPPVKWPAYIGPNERQSDRWMEKFCDPGDSDRGVESDWLRFYYEIYTTGSNKYSAADILAVHERSVNTYGSYAWDQHLRAASYLFSNSVPKQQLYRTTGTLAGVDHYAP